MQTSSRPAETRAHLQVSPESLALLREMGYRQQESARALRFCGGDVAASVAFIAEQCAKQQVTRPAARPGSFAMLSVGNCGCHAVCGES